jgi:two-component system sensor kinase FixL
MPPAPATAPPPSPAHPSTWLWPLGTASLGLALWCASGPASWLRPVAGAALGAAATLALAVPQVRRRTSNALSSTTATLAAERATALATASAQGARLQAIFDTATEGIVTIDETGHIETWNGAAERMFGHPAAAVVGRNVAMLMPEPYHSEHDGYLEKYRRTGVRHIIGIGREVTGQRADGSTFPIDLSVGEGWVDGRRFFTAVIRDITERKEMQTKLAQTERLAAVGELAAGVAHEVNNPVNTMINCAQLIADGDDAAPNCQVIIEEGQRIAEIVKDLLQFARDDSDRPQPTGLPEVLQRTLRLFGENLKRHGVAIRTDVPEDLPNVRARPQQVQQVLLNLLINAKDAMLQSSCERREVRITGALDGAGVRMSVADTGPGIPPHLGHRIFEPFVTTKRARGGTGLGLSISKSIVEGYGGTLDVQSQPGLGATFRIWLPLAEREA